jgi:3'-5' exoribonuclease
MYAESMSQLKPPLSRLSELTHGQRADFFALLVDRVGSVTREGKPYYHCRFRDDRRIVSFMAWSDDRWFEQAERDWQPGQFYKLRAIYQEHERYGPQIELLNLRPATEADREDGFDPARFVESSKHDLDQLWQELRILASDNIHDESLRALVLTLLDRHAEPLKRLPVTRDRAYAYRGGLLEHLVSVTRIAVDLAGRYALAYPDLRPPLNRDLVAAGAILHELGKVQEFGTEIVAPALTIPGRLTGPLVLGHHLLHEAAAAQPDLNPELLQLLEHILLTPLYPADGSGPRWSLIPEGLLVQYADDLDLKMALYVRCLDRDTGPGPFTERDPVLGRQLFKGRKV